MSEYLDHRCLQPMEKEETDATYEETTDGIDPSFSIERFHLNTLIPEIQNINGPEK